MIKMQVDPNKITAMLGKLNVPQNQIDWFSGNIAEIGYENGTMLFEFTGESQFKYSMPLNAGVIPKVIAGEVSALTLGVIKAEFNKLFAALEKSNNKMCAAPTSSVDPVPLKTEAIPSSIPAFAQPKPQKMLKPKKESSTPNPASIKSSTAKVCLKDATEVGQLVHGTSNGSSYKVVAIGGTLKIAARINGNKLSIRAESPDLPLYKQRLAEMGMSLGEGGGHMSMHLGIQDPPLFSRTLGSFLYGVGYTWDQVLYDIDEFKKGVA